MSTDKNERLAAIRAANAQKQAGTAPAAPATVEDKAARLAAIRAANAQKQTMVTSVSADEAGATAAVSTQVVATTKAPRQASSRPQVAVAAPVESDPSQAPAQFGPLVLAAVVGAAMAMFVIPVWLPGLSASLMGAEPKAYWYLSRSTAFVAYGLLWLSMALGLMMTNKLARLWPGGPVAFDLHQHASILGLTFGLFHALILLGDQYASYSLAQILIPFASGGDAPFWVGLGQVSLYLMGIVGLSFYVRPLIGRQGWRAIHFISFAVFGLVLFHGVQSGSDTGTGWAHALYWFSGGSLLFLTVYRVLVSVTKPAPVARPVPATVAKREALVEA